MEFKELHLSGDHQLMIVSGDGKGGRLRTMSSLAGCIDGSHLQLKVDRKDLQHFKPRQSLLVLADSIHGPVNITTKIRALSNDEIPHLAVDFPSEKQVVFVDRRAAKRFDVNIPCNIINMQDDSIIMDARTENISSSGLKVSSSRPIGKQGDWVWLRAREKGIMLAAEIKFCRQDVRYECGIETFHINGKSNKEYIELLIDLSIRDQSMDNFEARADAEESGDTEAAA